MEADRLPAAPGLHPFPHPLLQAVFYLDQPAVAVIFHIKYEAEDVIDFAHPCRGRAHNHHPPGQRLRLVHIGPGQFRQPQSQPAALLLPCRIDLHRQHMSSGG